MDNDMYRRGKLTCHKKYGEGIAMLAGDGLLNLAFGILAESGQKYALEIASVLSDAVGASGMIGGQVLDVHHRNRQGQGDGLKHRIDTMKTAALMAASCEVGALAARAKKDKVEKIRRFGMNSGVAFQIADDIEDSHRGIACKERLARRAKTYIAKAKTYIARFEKRADGLRCIADRILKKVEIACKG